ncbi:conserved hypothetical protein [Nostocoides japonicum T1-X7]|uniref:HTH marR-type domain-containing protein n=1 Tax=Nostocoides japonicum T1-X7 TaxID=1194083 RepID=A0A077M5I8_9MICO|nr:ROK family transcriptional regulator [Tetrasphaera japonica]CCH79429.1 conserved hypothetical protein [Tetrasphaera japonica T1-X7]
MPGRRLGSIGPGSPTALRAANESRILGLLATGSRSQAEVAREVGLAPSTVSNIVRDLVTRGVVSVTQESGRGRVLALSGRGTLSVGVDVGHRHIAVASVTTTGEVVAEERVDIGLRVTAAEATEIIAELFASVLDASDLGAEDLTGVGLGVPTPIEMSTRRVAAPSILPGWVGVDIADLVSSRLGHAVVVENDANLGALAERVWGAGRGCESLAYLKLSEGVGAGLILEGRLYRGRHGIAGEIGHTTMDEFGRVCRCGNRGCLETLVAARTVVDLLEPVRGPGLTIARIVALADEGDVACARVLADTGRLIGVALANLCNVFNPELVLLGGELSQAARFLLPPMREVVRRQGIPVATESLRIEAGALGAQTHVLGAAWLGAQHHGILDLGARSVAGHR